MAFKTDERYKISKCYDHELLHSPTWSKHFDLMLNLLKK